MTLKYKKIIVLLYVLILAPSIFDGQVDAGTELEFDYANNANAPPAIIDNHGTMIVLLDGEDTDEPLPYIINHGILIWGSNNTDAELLSAIVGHNPRPSEGYGYRGRAPPIDPIIIAAIIAAPPAYIIAYCTLLTYRNGNPKTDTSPSGETANETNEVEKDAGHKTAGEEEKKKDKALCNGNIGNGNEDEPLTIAEESQPTTRRRVIKSWRISDLFYWIPSRRI